MERAHAFQFLSPSSGLTDGIVPVPVSKYASLDTVRLPLAFLSRPGSRVSLPVSWGHLHFGFMKSVHASATADVQPPQRCEDGAVGRVAGQLLSAHLWQRKARENTKDGRVLLTVLGPCRQGAGRIGKSDWRQGWLWTTANLKDLSQQL